MARFQLAILNYAEAPEVQMIVLVERRADNAYWSYIADIPRLQAHQGWTPVSDLDELTELSVFGVRLVRLEGDYVTTEVFAVSAACYGDGEPRRWQGNKHISVPTRPYIRRELAAYFRGA